MTDKNEWDASEIAGYAASRIASEIRHQFPDRKFEVILLVQENRGGEEDFVGVAGTIPHEQILAALQATVEKIESDRRFGQPHHGH